ncbi:hypothetical protein Cgig2_009793 [Carnegiea gigantea]|uniref:DUF4283 domain-containing protein n=1 Tax=Carnegiea gigantea TaxID=171969 RepID=A0A9Q1GFM8_9CARY|nr:hypothetical protein Cgig2_009793 [Carnegiea gigantea]
MEEMNQRTETPRQNVVIVHAICTYASLVNPAEGIALKDIPMVEINGQNGILVYGCNMWSGRIKSTSGVVKGFVRRVWNTKSINKVALARKGVFLVRFTNMQDKLDVTQRGVYFFDEKPFIVKLATIIVNLGTIPRTGYQILGFREPEYVRKYARHSDQDRQNNKREDSYQIRMVAHRNVIIGPIPDYIDFINDWEVVVRQ